MYVFLKEKQKGNETNPKQKQQQKTNLT